MTSPDQFCASLLDQAKWHFRCSEVSRSTETKAACLNAALMLAFAALEAHMNAIAADFAEHNSTVLGVLDRSILFEQQYHLDEGAFALSPDRKMYSLEDRVLFIHRRFSGKPIRGDSKWWHDLKQGIDARNKLTHPRGFVHVSSSMVKQTLEAVVAAIDALYKAVYKRRFPAAALGLDTRID